MTFYPSKKHNALGGLNDADYVHLTATNHTDLTDSGSTTLHSHSNVAVSQLADGTDGELITWSAAGAPTTVAVGTATHVLTSNGVGVAPTFQAAAGGDPSAAIYNADFIPNNVVVGLLPATSATLISDISAGSAYINDKRVAKDATSHTYTAEKDTYVDLSSTGTYTFVEVALAAAAPALTADSYRLAKVVTDVDNITGVTNLRAYENTLYGYEAGNALTTGYQNAAMGYHALRSNTTGYHNAAMGYQALFSNTTGNNNAAMGSYALNANTIGYDNTAQGYVALNANTSGYHNAAIGNYALRSNTTGYANAAMGYQVLYSNTTGYANAAIGNYALRSNTTGYHNAAMGYQALFSNSTGLRNIAMGYYAGKYELGSDAFYINNQDRTDTAGDKAKSIIYGIMAVAVADQKLTFNADVKVTGRLKKSATAAITAFATGGQASAVELVSDINEVSVCATAADSVKLPAAIAGMEIMVVNHGAAAMDLFPASGDFINEAAVDTAVSIAINATAIAYCYVADNWEVIESSRA